MRSITRRKQEYRRPVYQQSQLGSLFQRLKNSLKKVIRKLKEVFNKLYMRYRCIMPRLHALGKEIAKRKIPVDIKYKGIGGSDIRLFGAGGVSLFMFAKDYEKN